MTIGMPAHLRPHHVAVSFSRAAHVAALIGLIVDATFVVTLQVTYPQYEVLPALIALVHIAVVLAIVHRFGTVRVALLYLIVGGLSVYWFAFVLLSAYPDPPPTDTFSLTVLRVVLALAGSTGAAVWSGPLWCIAGIAVAEVAIGVAAAQTGTALSLDFAAIIVVAMLALAFAGADRIQNTVRRTQPRLHRAANDDKLATTRFGIEARAAAVMHDTVLVHLAAIATAPLGPLRPDLSAQIERDLEVLVGEDWLAEPSDDVAAEARADWQQSPMFQVIQEVRAMGLQVEVSGDLSVIGRLDARRATALAMATKQCLVNVIRHSGTDRAELMIYGSESDVAVMVVDEGRGFSEAETGADRLGLRQSVRQRMESVDGAVQVWSAPGRGTSVMIRVPAAEASTEWAE